MPTTLPARVPAFDPIADFLSFLRALLRMYALLAAVIAPLIGFEAACGVFAGRPLAASVLIATGTEMPVPEEPQRVGLIADRYRAAF